MKPAHHDARGAGRVWLKFTFDLVVWTVAITLAFPLRLGDPLSLPLGTFLVYGAVALPLEAAAILGFGLPRQAWRQATVQDLIHVVQAVAVGTAAMFVVGLVLHETLGFPRTAPLIGGLLALMGMGGIRMLRRLSQEREVQGQVADSGGQRRVLLVGAGSAGADLARQLRRHPRAGMIPVGYLDDDPKLGRLTIAGLAVLGTLEDLPEVTRRAHVDQVLIAMPSSAGARTRRVVDLSREAGVSCRILPGITQILAGDVSVSEIREVQVEDLLRREPFELDLSGALDYLTGRVVLITGAGGSIGAELVRQIARRDPKRVVLFGRGENSLHASQQELNTVLPELDYVTVVGSVTDRVKVAEVLHAYSPDVVFHTAAHKHVPMMEHHPDEAVLNNVGGTRTVAEEAAAAGVRRFVNVSSDKAVNPVSMVGVTKSLAERVVRAVAREVSPDQAFVSVRFGNVLGSRGSVVPIFQEQIRRGGPVTLTHPNMSRYFMTIPEASRLVIQAAALADNGAVYVLDMGTPVLIQDLAHDMIRLAGADGNGIEIVYTGLRPGEKMTEELFTEQERTSATRYQQIMAAHPADPADPAFLATVDELTHAAERRDWDVLGACLATLVPGFDLGDRGDLQIPPM